MNSQRGFAALIYLIAAAAVLAGLTGLYLFVDGRGYARGKAETKVKWDEANSKAEREAKAEGLRRAELARGESIKLQAAQALAQDFERKWNDERAKARKSGKPLFVTDCQQQPSSPDKATTPASPAAPAVAPDVRLSWRFVRLYDTAWTGADGKPLYGDPAGSAPQAGAPDQDSSSSYDADDLLDVHAENAKRFSACIRDYNALIDTVLKLQASTTLSKP